MDRSEASYLAGLLDGEGCIQARQDKKGWIRATLEICMTNRKPLDWAQRVTRSGRVYSCPVDPRGKRRRAFKWIIGDVSVASEILRQTIPFMKVKRSEAMAFSVLGRLREAKERKFDPRICPQAEAALTRIITGLKTVGGV